MLIVIMRFIQLILSITIIALIILIILGIYGLYIKNKDKILNKLNKIRYIPKRISRIYEFKYMPGGLYLNSDKNSREAVKYAVQFRSDVQFDIQFSKDNVAFCFPNKYMLKLTGIPGKFSHITKRELKKYYMEKGEIIELKDALKIVSGEFTVLLSIQGNIRKRDIFSLSKLLNSYNGECFFEVTNIITYFKLRILSQFSKLVAFKYNLLRKKINFINNDICKIKNSEISSLEVILAIQDSLNVEEISERLFTVFSKSISRINQKSSLLNRPIVHRGIIDSTKYGEHEILGVCETLRRGCIFEGDITNYNGNLVWYHSDKFSSTVIKQAASVAEKNEVKTAATLEEMLYAIANLNDLKLHPAIIIDIKDARTLNRNLERKLLNTCEKYSDKIEMYFSYYNPMIGKWLSANYHDYRRIAVYNSLEGIKWLSNPIRVAISALLSNNNKSDAGNWNIGPNGNAIIFSKFVQKSSANVNLVYAPKNEDELAMFKPYFANWVVEDVANQDIWGNTFEYHDDGIITIKKNDLSDN